MRRFVDALAAVAWRVPGARAVAPTKPVMLLYHGVPSTWGRQFERHILFLKRHFEIVSPEWASDPDSWQSRSRLSKPMVAITFDDGFRNNLDVAAPILQRHRVPALFFVSSRHAEPGQYLWFVYLRKLAESFRGNSFMYDGRAWDMSAAVRPETMRRLWDHLVELTPHPTAMYRAIDEELPRLEDHATQDDLRDTCAGMTAREVAQLSADPLFTIGCHTVDHPYLGRCDLPEAERQLARNQAWIAGITGKPCDTVSYPIGDYTADIVTLCQRLGMTTGYAVTPVLRTSPRMEIPRIGVYADATDILGVKVMYGYTLRRFGVRA